MCNRTGGTPARCLPSHQYESALAAGAGRRARRGGLRRQRRSGRDGSGLHGMGAGGVVHRAGPLAGAPGDGTGGGARPGRRAARRRRRGGIRPDWARSPPKSVSAEIRTCPSARACSRTASSGDACMPRSRTCRASCPPAFSASARSGERLLSMRNFTPCAGAAALVRGRPRRRTAAIRGCPRR